MEKRGWSCRYAFLCVLVKVTGDIRKTRQRQTMRQSSTRVPGMRVPVPCDSPLYFYRSKSRGEPAFIFSRTTPFWCACVCVCVGVVRCCVVCAISTVHRYLPVFGLQSSSLSRTDVIVTRFSWCRLVTNRKANVPEVSHYLERHRFGSLQIVQKGNVDSICLLPLIDSDILRIVENKLVYR